MKRILAQIFGCISLFCVFSCTETEQEIVVESVTISQPKAEMIIGETITLIATITPSKATDKQLIWSSSKQSVATITQEGVVTAISEGEAIITASAGGKQGTCAVTVAPVADITITPNELFFESGANSQAIELNATRNWYITTDLPNWVSLSTTFGYADTKEQTISVTVLENNGYDREASITFSIVLVKCSLSIIQNGALGEMPLGTGTQEDPYTIHGVIKYVEALGADVPSTNSVYIKGFISSIEESFETNGLFGNASFYIVDADVCEESFYAYRTLFIGNRKWKNGDPDVKVGDEVVICGRVVNYKGKSPETVIGASYIYSLNGETAIEVD